MWCGLTSPRAKDEKDHPDCYHHKVKTSLFLPVDVSDVGVGDNDAVPASLQASSEPQRVQVVLVDDVSDGILPQQLLPPQSGGGAYVCAEGDVTGLPRDLAVAILQHVTVLVHGYNNTKDHLICDMIGVEKEQINSRKRGSDLIYLN